MVSGDKFNHKPFIFHSNFISFLLKSIKRYQKKIATYDKEPWEKTVEEKILYAGFGGGVRLKNAKLKTELIDVDLVRG